MNKKCYTVEELVNLRNLMINHHERLSNDSHNLVLQEIYSDMIFDISISKWKEKDFPTLSSTAEGYVLGVLDYHESLDVNGYKIKDTREAIVLNKKLSLKEAINLGRRTLLSIIIQECPDIQNIHENFMNWKQEKPYELLSYDEIQELEDTELVIVEPKEEENDNDVVKETKEDTKPKTEEELMLERLEPYPDLKELYLANDNPSVREFVEDTLTRFERDSSLVRVIPKDKLEFLKKLGKEFETKKPKPLSELTEEERAAETAFWDNYYRNKARLEGREIPQDWKYNLEKGIHEPPVKEEDVPKKKGFKKATAESIKDLKANVSFDKPHFASKDGDNIEFADGTIPKKFANNLAASDGFNKPKGKTNILDLKEKQAVEPVAIIDKDSKVLETKETVAGSEIKNPLLRKIFTDENIMKAFGALHNKPLTENGVLEEGRKILENAGMKDVTDDDVKYAGRNILTGEPNSKKLEGKAMPKFEEYKGDADKDDGRIPREEILYIDENGDLATLDEDVYNESYDEIVKDNGFLRVANGFVTIITGDHIGFMDASELVPEFEKVLADKEVAATLSNDFKASLKKFIDFHYKCANDGFSADDDY